MTMLSSVFDLLFGGDEPKPIQKGTPANVLAGCKKGFVTLPGTEHLAYTREGKPLMCKRKDSEGGAWYHASDVMGMDLKTYKGLQRNKKRKQ